MFLLLLSALAAEPLEIPEVPDDLLSRESAWSLRLSGLSLIGTHHDSAPSVIAFQLQPVTLSYTSRIETDRRTNHLVANAALGASVHRDGDTTTSLSAEGSIWTDQRLWFGRVPVFIGTRARAGSTQQAHLRSDEDTQAWVRPQASLTPGIGVGRVLELGPSSRAQKLGRLLADRGLLVSPIDDAVIRTLTAGWFEYRGRIGSYDALAFTERVLLDAGVIDRPFDTETSYMARNVIDHARFTYRHDGWNLTGWLEGGVIADTDQDDQWIYVRPSLIAQLFVLLGEDEGMSLSAEHRLSSDWDVDLAARSTWAAADVRFRWYREFFGEHQDPIGELSFNLSHEFNHGLKGETFYNASYERDDVVEGELNQRLVLDLRWRHSLGRNVYFVTDAVLVAQDNNTPVSGHVYGGFEIGIPNGRITTPTL